MEGSAIIYTAIAGRDQTNQTMYKFLNNNNKDCCLSLIFMQLRRNDTMYNSKPSFQVDYPDGCDC